MYKAIPMIMPANHNASAEQSSPQPNRSGALAFGGYELVHESNGRMVLKGLTLEINEGECVGLCGNPGSGKSLLAAILSGIVRPLSGEVRFGETIFDPDSGAAPVMLIPQGPAPDERLTVEQWIELRGSAFNLPPEIIWRGSDPLAKLGIANLRERPMDTLSFAERGLVWFAAEILADKPALIVDGLLDILPHPIAAKVDLCIRELLECGTGVLVLSSKASLLIGIADRVYALDDGRLKESE